MAEEYEKLTQEAHILKLPDTYIGSTTTSREKRWLFDEKSGRMVYKTLSLNPGLYKIFDEIIVNSRDAFVRSSGEGRTPVKKIDVTVSGPGSPAVIEVMNDGDGIPVREHEKEKCYIPELIFGNLLTSSNYKEGEKKIVGGKNGYGAKCLQKDTGVLLFNGKIKLAENVDIGDKLIGDDGTVRNVLHVIKGVGQMYKVEQSKGDSYVVNDEHILTLMMPDHKVIFWSDTTNSWNVLWWDNNTQAIKKRSFFTKKLDRITCEECGEQLASSLARHYSRKHPEKTIPQKDHKSPTVRLARAEMEKFCKTIPDENVFDISIKDYMKLNETTKLRLAGVRGKCVEWEKKKVALDPYVLGLWLGDGFQTGYGFALEEQLMKYDLINNKHIPQDYLVNDRETRLKVLAGLIDTDGTVSRDETGISIRQGECDRLLAEQIAYLSRSLGFCTSIHLRDMSYTYKGEIPMSKAYIINISGEHLSDIPTLLPCKKCANTIVHKISSSTGTIKITDAGIQEYVGIAIDKNERFVINDFTVTHNCTNIFSTQFTVDTQSVADAKKYVQTWTNNMSVKTKPSIKKATSSKGYVRIEFMPDAKRFVGAFQEDGSLTDDMRAVFHTRVVELAAMVGIKVTWNGVTVNTNTFEKYTKLFLKEGVTSVSYENCGPRWEVAAILTKYLYADDEEGIPEDKHVSFVNGIQTRKGGKHVEHVTKHVLNDFCELAAKKKVDIKPGQLKDHVVFFVNATIENPAFESQTKECLTTAIKDFGSSPKFSGKVVDSLFKMGLLDDAKSLLEFKASKEAKKTDGKKRSKLYGIPKLEDAMLAGTARGSECTLILTEGDSAATSAISGTQVVGRELWGIFPLRGKLLNVNGISVEKMNANEELKSLKLILGLEHGKKYSSTKDLRYGRVMIMADQDHDGSHIKGLVMNLFHSLWPSLLELGYLCTLLTPLLKASKGSQVIPFYSAQEFNAWKTGKSLAGWHIKYYKGLGTSTPAEAKEWFKDLHEIRYEWLGKPCHEALTLAFTKGKTKADDRKEWLSHYNPERIMAVSYDGTAVKGKAKANYKEFVDGELIHFSNADNIRSLPHLMDGLKPSQRKILWACLKRNLRSEIKVAQLAGYVSEHAAYHHGEASLNETIIGMAQTFVGSNNINLLKPIGQFGSRLQGGEDSASPRYIHTHLEPIVDSLFRREDAVLLKAVEDDGDLVEPEYYLPVVPLLAINGSVGIGTGFSTDIPPHNPDDIIGLLEHRLKGTLASLEGRALDPWWFGFEGPLRRAADDTWVTSGLYVFDEEKKTITINELPVGTWTKKYKVFLDGLLSHDGGAKATALGLKNFDDLYNDAKVKFVLYMTEDGFDAAQEKSATFEDEFNLTSSWKTTNMHSFNADFTIQKYKCIGDILEAYVAKRLPAYEARRLRQLEQLSAQVQELDAKRAFLKAILEDRLVLMKKTDEEIVTGLKTCGIPPLSDPTQPDKVDSYEFVLRLRIDRVKASAIAELEKDALVKRGEMEELEKATPGMMWLSDLADFRKAWTAYKEDRLVTMAVGSEATAASEGKKKRVVIRKK